MNRFDFSRAWLWWTGELSNMVPVRNRSASRRVEALPVVKVSDYRPVASSKSLLRYLGLKREVLGCVELSDALVRRVRHPDGPVHRYQELFETDIARFAPFSRGEVVTGWCREGGVVIHVMIKKSLAAETERLARLCGDHVRGYLVLDGEGRPLPVQIGNYKTILEVLAWRFARFALIASAVLASLAAWQSVTSRETALAQVTAQVGVQRDAAKKVRDHLASLSASASAVGTALRWQQEAPDVLGMLSELARVVPDDAWLSSFAYSHGEVRIEGWSPVPEKLVEVLEKSAVLEDVSLVAAVGGADATGRSSFTMKMKLTRRDQPP